MNKYLVFAVVICALALINAKSAEKENKSKKDSSHSSKGLKEIAQQINHTLNSTLFVNVLKSVDQLEVKCSNLEEKIQTTLNEIGTCVKSIELGSDTVCSLITKNFVRCFKPASDLAVSCLPTESKGLPILVEKAILAIVDTACSSTFEEVLEWYNPCALEIDPVTFQTCQEIERVIHTHRNTFPSKTVVCSTYSKVRNCAKEIMVTSCKNTITKNAHKKLYDGIDNALKDECDALNKA